MKKKAVTEKMGTTVLNEKDTGVPDTGVPDTGVPDTGVPDTGVPDTGVPDTGVKIRLIMQLRALGIRSTPVLSALEKIPREVFLPQSLARHAYDNVSLPLRYGQTISQPFVVARMTEALELNRRHRVLEIGTGSGYQAAILACLARRVYTIERLRPLLVEAERRLKLLKITNLTSKFGDGALGWGEAAPFDRIILTCGAATRPNILLKQLKPDGILITPIDTGAGTGAQVIRRYRMQADGDTAEDDILPVRFVPLITDVDILG